MNPVPFISRFGLAAPLQPALQLWCCTGSGKCVVDRCRVFAQHPVSIPVRLKTLHKGFHGYLYHILATCALEEGKRKTNIISALEKRKEALHCVHDCTHLCPLVCHNYNLFCSVGYCKLKIELKLKLTVLKSETLQRHIRQKLDATCVATLP